MGGFPQRDESGRVVSYQDLCFPKTSNYGSMKKKKSHSVGVECRMAQVVRPSPVSGYVRPSPPPVPPTPPPQQQQQQHQPQHHQHYYA